MTREITVTIPDEIIKLASSLTQQKRVRKRAWEERERKKEEEEQAASARQS